MVVGYGLTTVLAAERDMSDSKGCQCNLRTRLVGDGCRYCNPALHAELLEEQVAELKAEIESLRAEVARLRSVNSVSKIAVPIPPRIQAKMAEAIRSVKG